MSSIHSTPTIRVGQYQIGVCNRYGFADVELTDRVEIALITPELEFLEVFGRLPDDGDRRLGLRRMIEIQRDLWNLVRSREAAE